MARSLVKDYDYLPFGEELGSGIALRTNAQGYGAATESGNSSPQKNGTLKRDSIGSAREDITQALRDDLLVSILWEQAPSHQILRRGTDTATFGTDLLSQLIQMGCRRL